MHAIYIPLENISIEINISLKSVAFLILFCLWIIFLAFYMSRVMGPVVACILTYIARKRGHKCIFKLGSLSISLLSGKLMFRNFTYSYEDYTIYCNDGYLIFWYWRYIGLTDLYSSNLKGRVFLTLYGLRIHVYNHLEAYRKLKKEPIFEKLFMTMAQQHKNTLRVHQTARKLSGTNYTFLKDFWAFTGKICVRITNTRVYFGNRLLPTTLTIFSRKTSIIGQLREENGNKLVVCDIKSSKFTVSLIDNEEYNAADPGNLWKRFCAPRTMGSGFKVLQNATLNCIYRQSIFVDSTTEPICDLKVDFGKDVAIAYGPWVEACRIAFISFFYPTDFASYTPTNLLENVEQKVPEVMDITLLMSGKTTINLWFMRRDELNAVVIIIKNGFSIKVQTPLIMRENGYKTKATFNMKDVQFLPTFGFRKLMSCNELIVIWDTFFPKKYGNIQRCDISVTVNGATTWFVWDHVVFFQDFMREIASYNQIDLAHFIPQIWKYDLIFNDMEVIFVNNDKNWVDGSNPLNNFLTAFVVKRLTVNYDVDNSDFCPQIMRYKYEMVADETFTIKFHVPQRSTLSPVIYSLYENAFGVQNDLLVHVSMIAGIDVGWLDFLRAKRLTFTYDCTKHPIYPSHQSDLPARVFNAKTQSVTHPFDLEPDSTNIEIVMHSPVLFISGFAVWAAKNFFNDYCGLYGQQSDMDSYHAHTVLSKRLFEDVKPDIAKFRPLDIKFSLRLLQPYGHCLIHSIQTTGQNPDPCPVMKADLLVVEVIQIIRDFQCQACVGGLQVLFNESDSFKQVQEGYIMIDECVIRMESFLSEMNIPWDMWPIEYASAMEIIVGKLVGKIDPTQLVCLTQFMEGLLLLSAAVDEELLVPDIYDLCHHMNNTRTCPHSTSNLNDRKNPSRCEYSTNLKYTLFRVGIDLVNVIFVEDISIIQMLLDRFRICTCNCHELSFCTCILLGILQVDIKQFIKYTMSKEEWLECGSAHFQDIEFEFRLPFVAKNLHLMEERKKFLKKHDEYTKRLYFLWLDEKKCGCYGSFAFFGEDDLSGCVFMADFTQELACSIINATPKQPGFGQSIVCSLTKIFEKDSSTIHNFMDMPEKLENVEYTARLYSRLEKVSPISGSQLLLNNYYNYLNVYHIKLKKENAAKVKDNFKLIQSGINCLQLVETKENNNEEVVAVTSSSKQNISSMSTTHSTDERPVDWGVDSESAYAWGNISSLMKIFLTPLSIEVMQRLMERAELMFTAAHPSSLIQHIYASCAFNYHKQPVITTDVAADDNDSNLQNCLLLPKLSARFGVPPIYLTFFQNAVLENTFPEYVKKNYSLHTTVDCTVVTIYVKECHLTVCSQNQDQKNTMPLICFDLTTHYYAQFAKIVLMDEKNLYISWQKHYITNWNSLGIAARLRHINLIVLNEFDVPNVLLKGIINRHSSGYWIDDGELIFRIGEPCLNIAFCSDVCDKKRNTTKLQLSTIASLISWFYAIYRFQNSLQHAVRNYDEWMDLCLCKALSEAMELRDDLILSICSNSLNEVKRYAMASNTCASCKLMLFLMRCSMQKDETERRNYWKNRLLMMEALPKSIRKLALTALLNSWQQLLAPYIKIVSVARAKNDARNLSLEPMMTSTLPAANSNCVLSELKKSLDVPSSTLDLRSSTAAVDKNSVAITNLPKKSVSNRSTISLSEYFWPLFKICNLDTGVIQGVPLKKIAFSFKFMSGEFKVNLVGLEYKNNPVQKPHLFFLMDALSIDARISYNFILDEQQLNAKKAFVMITSKMLFPRMGIFLVPSITFVLVDLVKSFGSCVILPSLESTSSTQLCATTATAVEVSSIHAKYKWISTALNSIKEYQMTKCETKDQTSENGEFSITVNGNIGISAIKIESKIKHFVLILRLFNGKIKHNNVYFIAMPKKAIHEITLTIQDIKALFTEKATSAANAIFRAALTTITSTFRRAYDVEDLQNILRLTIEELKLNYIIGSLRVLKAKGVENIDESEIKFKESTTVLPSANQFVESPEMIHFDFDFQIKHGEMNAKMSSTIVAKYNLKNVQCFGTFPTKGTVSIENQSIVYTSFYSKTVPKWMRFGNFSITLPSLTILYEKRTVKEVETVHIGSKILLFSAGSYANIVVIIGNLNQSVSTDVLNMILYSHETAVAEFARIIEIVHSSTLKKSSFAATPSFFQVQMRCETALPWLNITFTDTTNAAFRITAETVNFFFTNRSVQNAEIYNNKIWGNATFCCNFKLGQIIRNEAFQEDELRELADLTTSVVCTLKFSPGQVPNVVVVFSRTLILFKFSAINRAKSILKDYNVSRDFWIKQKTCYSKDIDNDPHFSTSRHSHLLSPLFYSSQAGEESVKNAVMMKFTALFRDRITVCVPLYSNNYQCFTSALLIGLKDAEASLDMIQGANAEAKFTDFKIVFVEDFEKSVEDSWINGQEITRTNFALFPLGCCKFAVKGARRSAANCCGQIASIQCSIKGLIFDVDSGIGNLVGALKNTFAAIIDDEDINASEYELLKITLNGVGHDDEIDPTNEYASLVKPESRIRWVEHKIYEQMQKLNEMDSHVTEATYEWELRRLKKLHVIRVKQFKQSMLDHLKRHKLHGKKLDNLSSMKIQTGAMEPTKEFNENLSITGDESAKSARKEAYYPYSEESLNSAALHQFTKFAKLKDSYGKAVEKAKSVPITLDMQFFGEAGECTLRSKYAKDSSNTTNIVEIDSSHDGTKNVEFTRISLPSIETKLYYSSEDVTVSNRFQHSLTDKEASEVTSDGTSIPSLYISANVANMPQETTLTPNVADFLQQLLENLPQSYDIQVKNDSEAFSMTDTESLLTGIESRLKMNLLLAITIQSSVLRFEAHQQRAAAIDLLLQLPSLKLIASACYGGINNELDLSLSLRSFSICFYNPHQPSPLDAFALTLDTFTVGILRSTTIQLGALIMKITGTINIGSATFKYDMRKLSELIAFPHPWYRRTVAERLLLGRNQLQKSRGIGMIQPSMKEKTVAETRKKLVLEVMSSVQWKAFKAIIQMSSAMGDTNWTITNISTKILLSLNPSKERKLNIYFEMPLMEMEAEGGAISGSLKLLNLALNCCWTSLCNKPVSLLTQISFAELEVRLVWMSRTVIVAFFDRPYLLLFDDWKIYNDRKGKIKEAVITLFANLKYSKLQLIVTKATLSSLGSIAQKLQIFFNEQLRDSHTLFRPTNDNAGFGVKKSEQSQTEMFHWATILDLITDIQINSSIFPIPNTNNGTTIIEGRFAVDGQQTSLVLMEGEITADRWALFYFDQPKLVFSNAAQYAFVDKNRTVGIDLSEKMLVKLSIADEVIGLYGSKWTSTICKVERSTEQTRTKDETIRACLMSRIDEPLEQLFSPTQGRNSSIVLELFELPAMDTVLTSSQKVPINCKDLGKVRAKVLCSVLCKFHHALGVQTDFTTQVSFLPKLLRLYLAEQDKEGQTGFKKGNNGKETEKRDYERSDQRQYICTQWQVDPKIRLIDQVKWDPPVIDEILRKLQIFDHRNTIPKAVQRHVLDKCDIFASKALLLIAKIAKKASLQAESTSPS